MSIQHRFGLLAFAAAIATITGCAQRSGHGVYYPTYDGVRSVSVGKSASGKATRVGGQSSAARAKGQGAKAGKAQQGNGQKKGQQKGKAQGGKGKSGKKP